MTALDKPRAKPDTVGRFTLRRVLGQGAQATVWLGHDPRLDREVAVKLMRPGSAAAGDGAAMARWLHEARSVSRLNHPNIVPVFEADVHDEQPYLVFEYVDGSTLAETLRARSSPLGAREAVTLMIGVLDALQAAHAAGVVHRDLKPSNILVDVTGRARVMDFGIAARTASLGAAAGGTGVHPVVGTPGYMSPEATRGEPPSPLMDVFAAGLMLVEMLCGRPLIVERDPYRAIHRAATEDLGLPATLPSEVDEPLRALLRRAIARDGAQRLASAAAFRDGLQQWLAPPAAPAGAASGVLDFLLRKMRHKSDFPALSDSVARIQRVAHSEQASVASLSAAILGDVALTNKLLRMVNTAHYAQADGSSVSTITRAVSLVGFTGIRNMAFSLVLLEHMQDKLHANHLKGEFLRALMAGTLASELSHGTAEREEAFISAQFQNLGRLLTNFYFPEEARQVEQAMADALAPISEEDASIQALGMSYEDLGVGAARSWGLPDSLQRGMRAPRGEPPAAVPSRPDERLRWMALAANEVARALLACEPEQAEAAVASVAGRYTRAMGISVDDLQAGIARTRESLAQLAGAMGLQVAQGSPARRLLDPPPGQAAEVASADATAARTPDATPASDPCVGNPAGRDQAASVMAAGIQDITNAMVESYQLASVLRMILDTMLRALRLRRVVFCLRDARSDVISGRFGLGEGVETLVPHFRIATDHGTDLFAVACARATDALISDASLPQVAARLPAWFTRHVAAPAFLLLPLASKGSTFGLIYADSAPPGGIALDAKELALLRTLRNQAIMAFRRQG